jgi:hypothetical protein
MTASIWNLSWPLGSEEVGRSCRRCGESISTEDAFGSSESVCRPCQLEGDRTAMYLMPTSRAASETFRNAA